MSERDPFAEYHPDLLPHPLKRLCKALGSLLVPFHSGTEDYHSTHHHPFDTPLEPVTDWPLESDGLEMPKTWERYARQGQAIIDHAHPPDTAA